MSKSWHISRRAVLRGLGTAMGLPLLEAMLPAQSLADAKGGEPGGGKRGDGKRGDGKPGDGKPGDGPPRRAVFLFVPNGMNMANWHIEKEGPLDKLPATLEPLADHRQNFMTLSGLALDGGRAHGDGPGDHARALASFLTAAHPRKTGGKDLHNGISIDQLIAQQIGKQTRLPSLELGCEPGRQAGACDSGYSCVYSSTMSWRSATSPMMKEINPRAAFNRLFGDERTADGRKREAQQARDRSSILDFAAEDARTLHAKLGRNDQKKLDEYLHAVREIERRVERSEKLEPGEGELADYQRPEGIPRDYGQHLRLMMDMIVLALRTDSTRVVSFMFANAGSNRSYTDIDVRQGHHNLSHHGKNKDKLADIGKINRYHVSQLKYLLDALSAIDDGGASLLDRTVLVYGSGLADGNRHQHEDLPILVAGKGSGAVRPGRHVSLQKETPLANLYLAIAQSMGVAADKFADSTGPLENLV